MGYQTIEVRKVTPVIGAEVHGVDLTKPLGNQQFQEMHDALMDNLVIFFRDQKLSIDSMLTSAANSASCTSIQPAGAQSRDIPKSC